MISRFSEQGKRTKSDMFGGHGTLQFQDIFQKELLGGRITTCAVVTMMPGDSLGEHAHTENAEVYYMLEGEATIIDDGVESVLRAGDAQFCADGHTHGIYNHTDKDASFLAIIVKNV